MKIQMFHFCVQNGLGRFEFPYMEYDNWNQILICWTLLLSIDALCYGQLFIVIFYVKNKDVTYFHYLPLSLYICQ